MKPETIIKFCIVMFVVGVTTCLVSTYYFFKLADEAGGLQCAFSQVWNKSVKPEGCK